MSKIKAVGQLLRIRQYYKNIIIFLGIFFAGKMFTFSLYPQIFLAFGIICILSSMIYVLNDLLDMDADKIHVEKKQQRPLANGSLSKTTAFIILFLLSGVVLTTIIYFLFTIPLFSLMLGLLVITGLLYNFLFKNLAFADIISLSTMYIWRALAGCVIINVYISPWLTITVFLTAMLLASGKRFADLSILGTENAKKHKISYDEYSHKILDYILVMIGTSLFMTYTLYSVFGPVEDSSQGSLVSDSQYLLIYTTPVALFLIIRYLYLVHAKPKIVRHSERLIKDIPFLIGGILLCAMILCLLYLGNPEAWIIFSS